MGRKIKPDKNKIIICKNCNIEFEIPKCKDRQYCSQKCAQQYTKSKDKEWLNKRNITNLDKYGVKSPLESEKIRQTYKNNFIKNHGVSNPFLSEHIKNKINEGFIKKYGFIYPMKNNDISSKVSTALKGRKYNREKFSWIKWEKIEKYCEINKLKPLFDRQHIEDNEVKDPNSRFQFQCLECNLITDISLQSGYLPTCSKCSKYKGYSIIEEEILRLIQSYYNGPILMKDRSILKGRELDIYLPDLNIAIEINGIYWHSEIWGKYKNYHLSKTEDCLNRNIHLLHIFDYEWLYKKSIVTSIILNKLNLTPNKIYARKCEIREVSSNDKQLFLNNNHMQGNCVSKINLGLYYNNELVACMTFGKNRFKNDGNIEMIRFCNIINTNVIGGASKLLKYFIKIYKPNSIITFADRRYSLGKMYYNIGFKFNSFSKPNYFYWKNLKIYNRMNFQKHMLKDKLDVFDNTLSEYQNMLNNGFNRVWDCGNYKFIMEIKEPN